jgi:penicillin-binding protein 2
VTSLKKEVEPSAGNNLVLTLDADLQKAAAEALQGKMGAVIALDPRTGEVLVMHSQPGFDPTEMTSKGPDLWQSFMKSTWGPLRNKTLQDHYPAGSTFKIFTAIAGLENHVIDESTTINCPGSLRFGNRVYHCHKKEGHGAVNLRSAIYFSCDVYFYQLAMRLGVDPISKVGMDFGFGRRTGVELFHEAPGLMPTESWKNQTFGQVWTPGESLSAAIGQGANLVTPLQLANAYSTLINGGNLYRPYVVSRIENERGEVLARYSPELLGTHRLDPKYLEPIKDALWDVSNRPGATAYSSTHTPEKLISGKTGTVQVISMSKDELYRPCDQHPFEKRHHGWFVGYAPKDNPEIVIAVLGIHACSGSKGAAPVAKKIFDAWWAKKRAIEALKGPLPAPVR